ncbi:hypothetical protein QBC36DRAFT_338690 [Triangularia setosa]|uniref:F-box domain-containing protein n=1 Tax=Triangularia setosa TaxID=2587417 RepID=A0AAN6VYE2_9PEZI|nr:hypothetical protein QBC36DRAFT_338690 [Podospora setosa]
MLLDCILRYCAPLISRIFKMAADLSKIGYDSWGKEKEAATGPSRLELLPPELVYNILSYLSPIDLAAVSATSRTLYTRATADHLWQALIQENVPGVQVKTPSPCQSFKALYQTHDPRWFLPKYKIWFSDGDLTGRLIIARYDPRRGCIEGYQLVAASRSRTSQPWAADPNIMIHSFDPVVQLHLDKPVIQLDAFDPAEAHHFGPGSQSYGGITTIKLSRDRSRGFSPDEDAGPSRSPSPPKNSAPKAPRLSCEIPMQNGSGSMYSTFILSRLLTEPEIQSRTSEPFPYGSVWPPPTVPSDQRVLGTCLHRFQQQLLKPESRPSCRANLSDKTFRIRKWLTMRVPGNNSDNASIRNFFTSPTTIPSLIPVTADDLDIVDENLPLRLHIGEEIATYATLDPKLYTPTKEKPFRGIWVGDYSGHGCEFLLLVQPDDKVPFDPDAIQPRGGESTEDFEKRKYEETVYRGRLDAIKLTGDPNVPRGEATFRVDDLGDGGLVKVCEDEPFAGVRMVRSEGHVASTGFVLDSFIESQLLLVSHDRLAQYWIEWGHVSFFERVDVDRFLAPA